MVFEEQKQHQLSKPDMSKKGFIDKEILELVNIINKSKNYYTTSSCAGRTVLLSRKTQKKIDCEWLYTDHKEANPKKIQEILKSPPEHPTWLHMEPAILHVVCKDLKDAEKLLVVCKHTGFKYSGIISIGKRITVEVLGSDQLQTIVSDKNTLLITNTYLKRLIEECNTKMKRNKARIERFFEAFKTI